MNQRAKTSEQTKEKERKKGRGEEALIGEGILSRSFTAFPQKREEEKRRKEKKRRGRGRRRTSECL